MARTVSAMFDMYPEEGKQIGRMLAGYGDLEFGLAQCLGAALGDDDAGIYALFRTRGERCRLVVADALMRRTFTKAELAGPYEEMLGAYRWCTGTRNQYAHCHWFFYDPEGIFFFDPDTTAKSSSLTVPLLSFRHVDLKLLDQQVQFFVYTDDLLRYLRCEYQGEKSIFQFPRPERLEPPPRHNPPDQHPIPNRTTPLDDEPLL